MSVALDAVVAGYLGADLAPRFPDRGGVMPLAELLRPGKLVEVGPLDVSPGGAVANAGLALGHFGHRVALMGLVGADPLGDLLLGLLQGRGVDLRIGRAAAASTAYGIVIAPPGTDRIFLECPGCNATFGAADLDYPTIAQSRLFHFGYPPLMETLFRDGGAELEAIFRRVKGLGVATSLDMTLPDPQGPAGHVNWQDLLARVLPYVDIFAPSVEELLYMLAPGEWARLVQAAGEREVVEVVPEELCTELADQAIALGASIVLIKIGHRGGYLRTGSVADLLATTRLALAKDDWTDRRLWLAAFPADPARVRNACGAGDAAVAAFLAAILHGMSPVTAGCLAMRAGRDSLFGVDAVSGLASWASMTEELGPAER